MYCADVWPQDTAPHLKIDIHSHMTLYYISLDGLPTPGPIYEIDSDREDLIRIEKD